MDDVLICIFHDRKRALPADQSDVLSRLSNIAYPEDYDTLLRLIRQKPYRLVAVITMDSTFPSDWKQVETLLPCPFFLMSGLNSSNFPALVAMIESLKDSLRITEVNDAFSESLAFIEEHLCDHQLTLEMVAAQIYVSKYHYSRIFQRYIGSGFKEYVINKRMQKAMSLLRRGHQVTEVCFAVGYNDITHFGRVFKKTFGGSPSAFRLKHEYPKMDKEVMV
ncbi:helix-turn-helix transcriptional regulator [Paenibacillus tarimensis]|nr:helix-turn-helix transcriptional regulator [Paenibacillus tarimensis]